MNSDSLFALIERLESSASALVTAPGIESLLASIDGLPSEISRLPGLLEDPARSTRDKLRLQSPLRDCLVHLQRALIYAGSRLQHEHASLRGQLAELSSQVQWAERSRQSI